MARSVLRRGSFTSRDDRQQRVRDDIHDDNVVDAKPHRWNISAEDLLAKFRSATSGLMN